MKKVLRALWSMLIDLAGYLLLLIGLILIVAPGPGLIITVAGLMLLATNQIWARGYLLKLKQYLESLRRP